MVDGLQRVLARISEINGKFASTQSPASYPVGNVGAPIHKQASSIGNGDNLNKIDFQNILGAERAKLSGNNKKSSRIEKYSGIIDKVSRKHGVDAGLIEAVIIAESGGNQNAISSAGALGLMQLMPATARGLGVTNAFDPEQNIDGGTRYLKSMIDRFGDVRLALAAYNAGPGAVKKYGGIPPYNETRNYVNKVFSLYKG